MKRKVRPNVVSGGTAINLGNNLYYMRGKTHKQGGIDIGSNPKTGIEVENGEVVQTSPTGLRVFSAQPILNGISPANALLMGGNPNNIFNAQEAWKQANRVTDDGRRFQTGGENVDKKFAILDLKNIVKRNYLHSIDKIESEYSKFKKELIKKSNKIKKVESIDERPFNKNLVSYDENIKNGIPFLYNNDGGLKFYKKKDIDNIIYTTSKYNKEDLSDYTEIPYEEIKKMLPKRDYIGGNNYRQRVVDKVPGLKSFIKAKAEEYGINPNLLFHRFLREGIVDNWTHIYNNGIYTNEQKDFFKDKATEMEVSGFGHLGLDDAATNLLEGKYTLKNPNITWEQIDNNNEKGRIVHSPIFKNIWDGIEVKAAEMAYRQAELAKRGITGDQFVNAAYNMGLNHEKLNDVNYINRNYSVPNYFKFGGDDKENNKFTVRDNTRTKFAPQIGYLPTNKDIISINRSNKTIDDGITGFIPGIGDVLQGGQALIDLSEKNYKRAGLMAGLLFAPNILEKPIKLARKYIKAGKAVYNSRKILNKYDKLLYSDNPIVENNARKVIEFGDTNIDDIRGLSYYANEDNFTKMKRKGSNIKTVYPYPDGKFIEKYDNPLTAETVLNFELEKAASRENPTNKIMNKIIEDTQRLKSGRRVALIDDYSLSGDSYPLYERVLERNARKDVGKIDIVTDDNVIRMIELNKDAVKPNWKQNVDKSIQSLRDYTGNKNIPDRFTILGKTYVPAFQLEHFKYGGIHIKPSKRGTFTAAAKRHHMGVQEFARTVLNNRARYSAAMVKKANFARNASKWHKKELGGDMTKQYYITRDNIYSLGGNVRPKAELGTIRPQRYYDNGTIYYKVGDKTFTKEEFANIYGLNVNDVDTKFDFDDLTYIPKYTRNSNVPIKVSPTTSVDISKNQPKFNETFLSALPNPNYSLGIADKSSPKLSELPGGTISSTGNTPKNPYYSKLNVGLHKIGNYIKNNPDLIGLGINLTGNLVSSLINRSAIKGMEYTPPPIPISAQKLPTEVTIEPQVSSIKENVAGQERLIKDNTADSRVALARRQRVRNQGVQQYQTLFGNKLNTELQLLTADRLNRQGVDAQNVGQYNQWRGGLYDFENRRKEMLAENAVAGINNAAEAIAGERGYLARREARKQNARNMALIAISNPNAQKVIDTDLYEELVRRMGKYGGNFGLLRKRLKG